MPRTEAATASKNHVGRRGSKRKGTRAPVRYSVGLPSALAQQIESYASSSNVSLSKAIVTLVRLGLESQDARKREFFKRLRKNLTNDNPKIEDQIVDEFRALILGH